MTPPLWPHGWGSPEYVERVCERMTAAVDEADRAGRHDQWRLFGESVALVAGSALVAGLVSGLVAWAATVLL